MERSPQICECATYFRRSVVARHRGNAEGGLLVVHVYREEKEDGEEIVPAREASQRERRIYIQQTAG
jgi:uncharacterized DUF497 family protein